MLCGGTSQRLGGIDKTAQPLGDTTVLGALLRDLPADWPVVCVGVPRPVARRVMWTREDPPLGGPVAGIAAGLACLTRPVPRTHTRADTEVDTVDTEAEPEAPAIVVVIAGDQPFAGADAPRLVESLRAGAGLDGIAAAAADGRPQLLLCAYRRDALAAVLAGDVRDGGVYRTFAPLRIGTLALPGRATLDVDDADALAHARELLRPESGVTSSSG